MPYRFFIRRSVSQDNPGTTLSAGELAYTYSNKKLWIGHPDGEGNPAEVVGLTEPQADSNEVAAAAIAQHKAEADPHPQYLDTMPTAVDVGAESAGAVAVAIETHIAAVNPHPQYEAISTAETVMGQHLRETDPHPQYLDALPTPQQIGAEVTGVALALLQQHLATNDPHQIKSIDADYEPEQGSIISGKNAQSALDQLAALIAQLQTQVRSITPSEKPPLIADPFVNSDGKELKDHYPITYQGSTWVVRTGKFTFYNNRLRGDGTAQSLCHIECTKSTGIAIIANIILRNITTPQGLVLRLNSSNGYHVRIVYSATKFELLEVSSSTATRVNYPESINFDQAYRFKVLLENSKITLLVNGIQKLSWTTTFNQGETKHGLYPSSSTTTQFEDFEITQL